MRWRGPALYMPAAWRGGERRDCWRALCACRPGVEPGSRRRRRVAAEPGRPSAARCPARSADAPGAESQKVPAPARWCPGQSRAARPGGARPGPGPAQARPDAQARRWPGPGARCPGGRSRPARAGDDARPAGRSAQAQPDAGPTMVRPTRKLTVKIVQDPGPMPRCPDAQMAGVGAQIPESRVQSGAEEEGCSGQNGEWMVNEWRWLELDARRGGAVPERRVAWTRWWNGGNAGVECAGWAERRAIRRLVARMLIGPAGRCWQWRPDGECGVSGLRNGEPELELNAWWRTVERLAERGRAGI